MKTIIDIENASAGALKAGRTEAISIANAADHDAVAERYVQARLDATTRDELLLDQGDTITTIKTALAEKTELAKSEGDRAHNAEALLIESRAATNRVDAEATEALGALKERMEADLGAMQLKASNALTDLTGKTELAKRRRAALAEVVDTATQAIADISAVANRLLSEE